LILGADQAVAFMPSNKPEGIVIGHSMGGLVAREIARMPSRVGNTATSGRFAGMVTIASSHTGAFIGNSVANGSVSDMISEASTRLLAGPLSTLPIVGGIILQGTSMSGSFVVSELKKSVPTVGGAPKIRVGHPDMVQLNNATPPNMPKVALQAVEQEPILWRLINHVTADPANVPVNSYNDNKWPNNIDALESFYYFNTAYWTVGGIVLAFFAPPLAALSFVKAAAWLWGATWFEQANDEWHWIIGAAHSGTVVSYTGRKKYACEDERDPNVRAWCETDCQQRRDNGDESCWYDEVIYVTGTVHEPSDAVVPLTSQLALPGKLDWTVTAGLANGDPTGCGHQEARNHPGITKALTDIFLGTPNQVFRRP
jgi:pimeloyl-ACP methyl ester carboxylesterase